MFIRMGYIGDISLLSKFRKPNIPPMWNGLFTFLLKSLSKRVGGSDSTSKLFCTLIYGLYTGVNLDYGSILWDQLIQSTVSTSRHSEISYARFLSIIVKGAITRLQIQLTDNFVMAVIPFLHTSDFMVSDPTKFSFIDSIPEAMLLNIPADNIIVNEYRKLHVLVFALCQKTYERKFRRETNPKRVERERQNLALPKS